MRFVQVTDTEMPDPRPKLEVPENWLDLFPSLQLTQAQKEADKNAEAAEEATEVAEQAPEETEQAKAPAEESKPETGSGFGKALQTTQTPKTDTESEAN